MALSMSFSFTVGNSESNINWIWEGQKTVAIILGLTGLLVVMINSIVHYNKQRRH